MNCTRDTLYFGASRYDNIDSVKFTMYPDEYVSAIHTDTDDVFLWNGDNVRKMAVYPDSMCSCDCKGLFDGNDTGYVFVVKMNVARNYHWDEIRHKRLYDKMVLLNDETNPELLKYKGKQHITKKSIE